MGPDRRGQSRQQRASDARPGRAATAAADPASSPQAIAALARLVDGPGHGPPVRDGRGWSPATAIALQRLAGNAAVAHRVAPVPVTHPDAGDAVSFRAVAVVAEETGAPSPAVPARHDAGGLRVQRHSSWEHKLLGDVDPKTLQVITKVNEYAGKPYLERKLGAGGKPLPAETAAATHALQQQLETLAAWQAAPPSPGMSSWQGMTIVTVNLDDRDAVAATLGEVNTLADYYGSLDQLKRSKKETTTRILQTVRRQSWVKLHGVLEQIDPGVAKGIKEPGFEGALTQTGQALDLAFQKLTMDGRNKASETYLSNVARNACHFAPQSWYRWKEYHERARKKANQAHAAKEKAGNKDNASLGKVSADLLNDALLENGFGDHYLQDSFASGHLINKTLIMQWFIEWMGTMSGPEAALSSVTGRDESKGASYLKDWDRLKRMQSGVQTKLAGLDLYDKPAGGRANDPQSAEEEGTRAGRIARTGLEGPDKEQAYGDYQAMLDNAAVQLASGELHNHFCKAGLTVLAGGTPVGKIYGDDSMLSGGEGIEFSAETARLSREAITNLAEGKAATPTSEIMARFPDQVELGKGEIVSLKEWHTGGKLRAYCESEIFPRVKFRVLGHVPTALGGAVSKDAPGGTATTEDPLDRLRRSIPDRAEIERRIRQAVEAIGRRAGDAAKSAWGFGKKVVDTGVSAAKSAWGFGKKVVDTGVSAAESAWDLGRKVVSAGAGLADSAIVAGGGALSGIADAALQELATDAAQLQGLAGELPDLRDELDRAAGDAAANAPEPSSPGTAESAPVPARVPAGEGAGGLGGDVQGPF
jgi:hypothetical protein